MTKEIAGMQFSDVSAEEYRIYTFPGGEKIRVDTPQYLNVSKSGGHRIIVSENSTVYIPAGWLSVQWVNRPGTGPLQF